MEELPQELQEMTEAYGVDLLINVKELYAMGEIDTAEWSHRMAINLGRLSGHTTWFVENVSGANAQDALDHLMELMEAAGNFYSLLAVFFERAAQAQKDKSVGD